MKALLLVAFLLTGVFLCSSLVAEMAPADDYKLLDSTTEKAVLVPGTQTSDGHYALAWTVLPKKNAEPVDWSTLDTGEFEQRYLDEEGLEDVHYEPANLVVDLRAKKVIGRIAQGTMYVIARIRTTPISLLAGDRSRMAAALPWWK
ncbi:MAG TPA: hypothetical protein VGK91_04990 [Candidatus Udaeobacter sp.]